LPWQDISAEKQNMNKKQDSALKQAVSKVLALDEICTSTLRLQFKKLHIKLERSTEDRETDLYMTCS